MPSYHSQRSVNVRSNDPLLALLCGKKDLEGKQRRNERDRGQALAGKSTLNRLETAGSLLSGRPRCEKIVAEMEKLEEYFAQNGRAILPRFLRLLLLPNSCTCFAATSCSARNLRKADIEPSEEAL